MDKLYKDRVDIINRWFANGETSNKKTMDDWAKSRAALLDELFDTYAMDDNLNPMKDDMNDIISCFPDFLIAPASTKYHGAYSGGLFDHSIAVLKAVYELSDVIKVESINPIAVLFHDLCKCDMYTEKDGKYQYAANVISIDHGSESLRRMMNCGIVPPERWQFAIAYHMGAFSDDSLQRTNYGKACEKYPEVLLLHTADMIASKIMHI